MHELLSSGLGFRFFSGHSYCTQRFTHLTSLAERSETFDVDGWWPLIRHQSSERNFDFFVFFSLTPQFPTRCFFLPRRVFFPLTFLLFSPSSSVEIHLFSSLSLSLPLPTKGSYWDQITEKGGEGGPIIKMPGTHTHCLNFTSISNSKCRKQKVRYCGQQSVDCKPSTSENEPTILCETSG